MATGRLKHTKSSIYGVLQLYTASNSAELKAHLLRKTPKVGANQRDYSLYEYRVKQEFVGDFGFSEMILLAKDQDSAEAVIWYIIRNKVRNINK